ncbi:hypothetical protein D5R81_13720 [Parashewanella spongiae]|uniref:Alginate export domain-containing protein n=1 Tax=Parashewanella spongiae TaxID=342950 RepID=A0A3A6TDP2_9GAMM|nr:alginate export family protein [Parashewanella spongiae]MCL1079027.1 alginate export family protein [Parashewanella spongiae]RJY10960.1 hypothetical protein D5R81_13720 [Parashewanella spongiae]
MMCRPFLFCSVLLCLSTSTLASSPSWNHKVNVDLGYVDESDRDLGHSDGGASRNGYVRLTGQADYQVTPDLLFMAKARGFYSTNSINLEPEEGGQSSDGYLALQQLYFTMENILTPTLSASIGHKRLKENSGLWWDRNITMASVNYDRSLFSGFVAIAEQVNSFRTDGSDYQNKDTDIFRIMAGTSWQWKYHHYFDVNYSYINDHSGAKNTRLDEVNNGIDLLDPKTHWIGIHPHGQYPINDNFSLSYNGQYIIQKGQVTRYETGNRQVSTAQEKDVDAWLVQSDLQLEFNSKYQPVLGVQYVTTSDNSDSDTEGRFFQTGLQSNRSRITANGTSITRYNDAFRPELSNISIIGTYLGIKFSETINLNLVVNKFSRVNSDLNIGYSGINSPLVVGEKDLGVGADVVVNYNNAVNGDFFKASIVQLRLSSFYPGDAYSQQDGKKHRIWLNWRVNI